MPDKEKKPIPKILICGVLPPPYYGHSRMYEVLMSTGFVRAFNVEFLNMHFWTYEKQKQVTLVKLLKMVGYYFRFLGLILTFRPQYVLYNMSFYKMPFLKDFLFCMTGCFLGRRLIIHDHGHYLKELYDQSSGFKKKMVKNLMRRVTASLVLGESVRTTYQGFMDLERVLSVPAGISEMDGADSSPKLRPRAENGINILYFSFVSEDKGCLTALESIPSVVRKYPNVKFTFAGPVESARVQARMNVFIEQHQLKEHVEFLGYVGHARQKAGCFHDADIFIFPTHRDVFGFVLIEALSFGKAIIASEEGTIPEILEQGKNGLLFPVRNSSALAQKINHLIEAPDHRLELGRLARQRYLTMYTQEQYGRRMIHAMQKIESFPGQQQ